mmetsp:Transcript_28754/g.73191  ORF Transcript_28754/g.73191 Transcript_28754/m.73191 type:complete len:461 (-) Transcript_28754:2059-3441(-)
MPCVNLSSGTARHRCSEVLHPARVSLVRLGLKVRVRHALKVVDALADAGRRRVAVLQQRVPVDAGKPGVRLERGQACGPRAQAVRRVALQQAVQQVLRVGRQVVGEDERARADLAVDAQLVVAGRGKRRLAGQQAVYEHAQRPQVRGRVVAARLHHLGRQVLGVAAQRVRAPVVLACKPKVHQLHLPALRHNHAVHAEAAVERVRPVQVLQAQHHRRRHKHGALLVKRTGRQQHVERAQAHRHEHLGQHAAVLERSEHAGHEEGGLQRARDLSRAHHQRLLAHGAHVRHAGHAHREDLLTRLVLHEHERGAVGGEQQAARHQVVERELRLAALQVQRTRVLARQHLALHRQLLAPRRLCVHQRLQRHAHGRLKRVPADAPQHHTPARHHVGGALGAHQQRALTKVLARRQPQHLLGHLGRVVRVLAHSAHHLARGDEEELAPLLALPDYVLTVLHHHLLH